MLIGFMLFPSSSAAGSMFRLQGLCRLHPLYPLDLRSGFGRGFPNGWINYGMDKGKGPELCDFHTPLVQSHSIEFIRTPFRKPFAILLEGAIMCDKTQKNKTVVHKFDNFWKSWRTVCPKFWFQSCFASPMTCWSSMLAKPTFLGAWSWVVWEPGLWTSNMMSRSNQVVNDPARVIPWTS